MSDLIDRQEAIDAVKDLLDSMIETDTIGFYEIEYALFEVPSAQPEIAENLYMCKCYITDKDGLQHEVIHTDDIRRVTGWEI